MPEDKTIDDFVSDDEQPESIVSTTDVDEECDAFCHDYSSVIFVDNIPKVPFSKFDKLKSVLFKILSPMGTIASFHMPSIPGANTTAGFAILAYSSAAEAKSAVATMHNFVLDKKHTLQVNHYQDYVTASDPTTPLAPYQTPEPLVSSPPLQVQEWCERGDEMFALRFDAETEIHWYENNADESIVDYDGTREKLDGKSWCSQYVSWSPNGSYLATFHVQGIALWATAGWTKIGRLAHKSVKIAVFSPAEKYLVTCSEFESDKSGIIIWDVATCNMLRAFPSATSGLTTVEPFRWSPDDSFVARRGKDALSIYETPSMKLLDKKSLPAPGVVAFFWSPKTNVLAYWAPEGPNCPARVSVVSLPSRREIRRKNLFNVSDVALNFHPQGLFLAAKVTMHSKSRKTFFTNFELFRLTEDLVPVELLELKKESNVSAFGWEPKGTRFALSFGSSNARQSVSFYDMCGGTASNELTLLYTLSEKACNAIYWSPLGNYVVLAGLGDLNGTLEFWNTDDASSLAIQDHFKCTMVDWDPSGRVVATAATQAIDNSYYKFQVDNGYNLWSFQGKNLVSKTKDHLYQFLWRPRPKSLLSDDAYIAVVKNLKKYERKYLEADRKKSKVKAAGVKLAKQTAYAAFATLVKARSDAYHIRRAELIALRSGYDSEDDNLFERVQAKDRILTTKSVTLA